MSDSLSTEFRRLLGIVALVWMVMGRVMLFTRLPVCFYAVYFTGNETSDLVHPVLMTCSSLIPLLASMYTMSYREIRAKGVEVGYATSL